MSKRPPTSGEAMLPVQQIDVTDQAGQRLDNFLIRLLSEVPRSRVYRMLRTGEVRVNGGRKKPTYRLQTGDRVRVPPHRRPAAKPPTFIGDRMLEDLASAVIFEDDDLLVVNKPAGLAVHGGSGVAFGLIEAMRRLKGPRVELAHRLDRDTSGCLLLAKRPSALRRVHRAIRDGSMHKCYRAIVWGGWPGDLVTLRQPLRKFVTASGERRVKVAADGKASRTEVQVLETAPAATLLQASLITGRTHQIRVHCLSAGHALVGDRKYGNEEELAKAEDLGIRRLCLHAHEVALPWLDAKLTSPIPDDFEQAWRRLKSA